ncbi:MAG: TSUP family transporter, partial [Candidatus Obscuribacterales bacterium]|nr:TSUP family transporter [Candidatus Obscuribacterales bacterium]
MSLELVIVFLVALFAGGVASISGFGIGSLLTPLLALRLDLQLAVAAVSIPHVLGTAARFALIHKNLRKDIFISFGIWSAIGGLSGALIHNLAKNPTLITVFAGLLIFAGGVGTVGLSEKLRCPQKASWLAGLLSGIFGG